MKQPRLLYLVLTGDDGRADAIRQTWAKGLAPSDELLLLGKRLRWGTDAALRRALAKPGWDFLLVLGDQTYAVPERLVSVIQPCRSSLPAFSSKSAT